MTGDIAAQANQAIIIGGSQRLPPIIINVLVVLSVVLTG